MKGPGILWLLQTAAGISMAGPMFVVGVGFLRSGQLVGGIGFLALGAATLYFPTYLVKRIGGPRTWASATDRPYRLYRPRQYRYRF